MDITTDIEYLHRIAPNLERFSKTNTVWKCRCPFCGDSQKDKRKTRFYIYPKGEGLVFFCHNCSETGQLSKLINRVEPTLYGEYVMKNYINKEKAPQFQYVIKEEEQLPIVTNNDLPIPKLTELPKDHKALVYMRDRMIPEEKWDDIYFSSNFKELTLKLKPDYSKTLYEEERIVFPIRNRDGVLVGVIGNTINSVGIKYIIYAIKDEPLVYGIEKVDTNQTVYVTEGIYDSFFIPNAVANLGSAVYMVETDGGVYISDNEPRNPEIVNIVKKSINLGLKVVIWPERLKCKDINEMVKSGISPSQVLEIIQENTYENLEATLKFTNWKKI